MIATRNYTNRSTNLEVCSEIQATLFCSVPKLIISWFYLQERTILSDARANLVYHVVQLPISWESMYFCNNFPRKSFCRFQGHYFFLNQSNTVCDIISLMKPEGMHSNPPFKFRIARTPSTSSNFAELCYSCTWWAQWGSSHKCLPWIETSTSLFWPLWTFIPENLILFLKELKISMPPPCVVLCMKATQKDSATISKSVVEGFQRLKTFTTPSFSLKMNAMIHGERSCLSLKRCIILRDKREGVRNYSSGTEFFSSIEVSFIEDDVGEVFNRDLRKCSHK